MRNPRFFLANVALIIFTVFISKPVFAHTLGAPKGGFIAGFFHPISGPDHVMAMVAVGLWGTILGPPALWILPIAFPMVMAMGGLMGFLGIHIPGVEIGIALSALILGVMVLIECKPALWIAMVMVSIFAIFHGHAHGTELPAGSSALQFSIGFVVATGLLHLIGIGLGEAEIGRAHV